MAGFKWTKRAQAAAISLASGETYARTAAVSGAGERTLYRWRNIPEFNQEVDRLSLMIGIASRAERMRIANRVIRQMVRPDDEVETGKDLLDWLRYAQGETDGFKIGLMDVADTYRDESEGD